MWNPPDSAPATTAGEEVWLCRNGMQICGKVAASRHGSFVGRSTVDCTLVWGMALPHNNLAVWGTTQRFMWPRRFDEVHFSAPTSRRGGPSLYFSSLILIAHYLALSECLLSGQKHDPEIVYRLIASFCCHSGHDVSSDWMSALLTEWWVKTPPFPLNCLRLNSCIYNVFLENISC